MESPSVAECVNAREIFVNAYREAAMEPTRSHEMNIKIALTAVWMAGREYQMNLDRACAALTD